jgi:hypothetical protein
MMSWHEKWGSSLNPRYLCDLRMGNSTSAGDNHWKNAPGSSKA